MKAPSRTVLLAVYRRLLAHFGPRHWWPARSPFEVAVGAILTRNTAWTNVEQAIQQLRRARALSADTLARVSHGRLARWIRPAGYFNVKARRLRAVVAWWVARRDPVRTTRHQSLEMLRQELLGVHGIGPETADSILLYALGRPSFVVDAYTKRVFARHGWASRHARYEDLQQMLMTRLPRRVPLYNEYHALIVELGKQLCRKRRPRYSICPLRGLGVVRLEAGVVPA